MRIATWNLAGRWDARHADLLAELDADVLLLTEVSERIVLTGFELHLGEGVMAPRRRWAAIGARSGLTPRPDAHFASAGATVDGRNVVSSILPWRSCGNRWPGHNTYERTRLALAEIEPTEPQIWGGDFNHAFEGTECAGSKAGRTEIRAVVERLGLRVPTAKLPHRIDGCFSIDHVAIPRGWVVDTVEHVPTVGLSDHDAYLVGASESA